MFLGTVKLGNNLTFYANTHTPSTGAAVDADAAPGYRVYEDETATPLLTGSMALLDDANTTGFYSEQIAVTVANGFEVGKSYVIRITGVVGGVTGVEIHQFECVTRQQDDLAYPATTGRSLDVDTSGRVLLQPTQTGVTIPTVTTLTNAPTGMSTFVPGTDVVAHVTLVDTVTTLTNKTGFSLAATGLDSIPVTDPGGVASTFPAMVVQLWRRFFRKTTLTSTQLKTYGDDGTTVRTTQTVDDNGTTQTQGAAS